MSKQPVDAAIASVESMSSSDFESAISTFGETNPRSLADAQSPPLGAKQKALPVIRIPSTATGISPKNSEGSDLKPVPSSEAATSSNPPERASASRYAPYYDHYDGRSDSIAAVFDSVPFTPSQGVMTSPMYPLHISWSFMETPTGQDDLPNTLGGSPPSVGILGHDLSGSSPPILPNPYLADFRLHHPFGYTRTSSDGTAPPYPHGIVSPLMGSPVGTPTHPVMFASTPFAQHHNMMSQMSQHGPSGPLEPGQYDPYGLFHPMMNYSSFLPATLSPQQSYNSNVSSPPKPLRGKGHTPTRLSWNGSGQPNSAPHSPPIGPPPPPPPPINTQRAPDTLIPSSPDPYFLHGSPPPPHWTSPPPQYGGYYMQPQPHYSPYHSLMTGPPSQHGSPMMIHAPPPPPPPPPPPKPPPPPPRSAENDNGNNRATPSHVHHHLPVVPVINTSPMGSEGLMNSTQPSPPTHVPISAVPGYLTPIPVYSTAQRAPIHLGSGSGPRNGMPPLPPSIPSSGETHKVHKSDKSSSPMVELKLDAEGLPKLNARQRRTLRRAKDRCVAGLIDAGSILLKAQGDMPSNHLSMGSAAADNGSEDGRDEEKVDRSDLYLSSALKVAMGEVGAEAAEAAREVLSKVASDLRDITLTHLMSGLMLVDKPTETIDLNLVMDLRVIRKISEALSSAGLP